MTLSLSDKIKALYPELPSDVFLSVIRLQDDGAGAYIKEWNHPSLPKPTDAQLDGVDEAAYTQAQAFAVLRTKRDQLLAETDYLALSDVTLSSEMTTYRQALRDLPANTTDPANPVWPTKPEA